LQGFLLSRPSDARPRGTRRVRPRAFGAEGGQISRLRLFIYIRRAAEIVEAEPYGMTRAACSIACLRGSAAEYAQLLLDAFQALRRGAARWPVPGLDRSDPSHPATTRVRQRRRGARLARRALPPRPDRGTVMRDP
jgi:hypothetical protein